MSLDVYLISENPISQSSDPKIWIRKDGSTQEISREEWDRLYPNREPVTVENHETTDVVFSHNITHNLTKMADVAGIYTALWHPEDIKVAKAKDLIAILSIGLAKLIADPDKFRQFNPKNGWGTYESLCNMVSKYIIACNEYPNAKVEVSR